MNEITEKVRKLIENNFHIKSEDSDYIYFKYTKRRGEPSC